MVGSRLGWTTLALMLFVSGCACHHDTARVDDGSSTTNKVARPNADGRFRPVQRAILSLVGQACELYQVDVEAALRKLSGVKDVDVRSMKGHAIVTIEAGGVSPAMLLSAVSTVRGADYYCKAKLVSQ